MKKLFTITALLAGVLIFDTNALAEEEDEEESKQPIQEVFQTELVYPQEKGEIQLTVVPRFQEGDDRDVYGLFPFVVEYGFTDYWQIELEWDAFVHQRAADGNSSGIGDLEIGTKLSWMNILDSNFHAAVGLGIGLPTGNPTNEIGEGMLEFEPLFIVAKDFPKLNNSQLFTQVGAGVVTRLRGAEEEAHEISWNSGFFVPFWQLRYTTEFNWTTNQWNGGSEDDMYLTPGLVWDLPGTWEVGVGAPIGLKDDSDNFRIIAMLTYEFNVLGEDED